MYIIVVIYRPTWPYSSINNYNNKYNKSYVKLDSTLVPNIFSSIVSRAKIFIFQLVVNSSASFCKWDMKVQELECICILDNNWHEKCILTSKIWTFKVNLFFLLLCYLQWRLVITVAKTCESCAVQIIFLNLGSVQIIMSTAKTNFFPYSLFFLQFPLNDEL